MVHAWKIELFGHLQIRSGTLCHSRFYSQKVASLLAYLAFFPERKFGREEIIERFWPESDLSAGRASLRTALASLRRQLEPPGTPFGSILFADYSHIRLNSAACMTDAVQFEAAVNRASLCASVEQRTVELRVAYDLYRGELLPGFYEDWILTERDRLALKYYSVTTQLRDIAAQHGDLVSALDYAWRLVAGDSLAEEAHVNLLALLVRAGQLRTAQQQYERWWEICREQLGNSPSPDVRRQARQWNLQEPITRPHTSKVKANHHLPRTTAFASEPAPATLASSPRLSAPVECGLPLPLTRFFGREGEVSRLREQLRRPEIRLMTLTGIGGIGKTRLAIETAREYATSFEGRIVFVPLADLTQADLLPVHLLGAFGLQAGGAEARLAQLAEALEAMPTLLVLDNFEQLLPDGVDFVLALLASVPSLQCLVTSRQQLDVVGEHVFPLAPLLCPVARDAEALSRCPSVQLLVDRAQSVRPDFQVTVRNAEILAALCTRLEGVPLALELAAARIHMVTATQLQAELQNSLDFLVARKRNVAPRHRSLRATLDWSYDLLTLEQQRFLVQLAVFRGGWTIESAQIVCAEPLALSQLEALYACSLVLAEESDEGIRFRLLETVREYCVEKRMETGSNVALFQRHWRYYCEFAERLYPLLRNGPDRKRWREQLEAEYDNFRAALHWCREAGADEEGALLSGHLAYFWLTVGYTEEGWGWLTYFLNRSSDDPATDMRAHALHGAGTLAAAMGMTEAACELFQRALTMSRHLEDKARIALILNHYGFALLRKGDYAASFAHYEESMLCYRELQKQGGTAYSLAGMARASMHLGDLENSSRLFEESISLLRHPGLAGMLVVILTDQGTLRFQQRDYLAARQAYAEAVQFHREQANRRELAYALSDLGQALCRLKACDEADTALEESQSLFRALGDRFGTAQSMTHLAHLRYLQCRYSIAQELAREALALWKEQKFCERANSILCLELLAGCAAQGSRLAHAARLLACVATLRVDTTLTTLQEEVEGLDSIRERIRASVTADAFDRYRTDGTAMTLEQAVDYALGQRD